jgi:hypothetical protein
MTPDLHFLVLGAEPVKFAASPLLSLKLSVRQNGAVVPIHTVVLRCQIRIDPTKRRYGREEQERLLDLFDRPERWGQTLRPMLWLHISVVVPPFTDHVAVDLPVPCTYDFNVAATKYFLALEDGEVPLTLLFSGTIFHEGDDGRLQVAQIPWEKEAAFRLPVGVWEQMMTHYYPNSAWLCLRRDAFDRLDEFKRRHGLPTWEAVIDRLLPIAAAPNGV